MDLAKFKPSLAVGPAKKLGFPSLGKVEEEIFDLTLQTRRWYEHIGTFLTGDKYLMASKKLDGIRCTIKDGELYSRSLKLIANVQLRDHFKELIVWNKKNGIPIDGEIYCHGWEFGDIQSVVNSSDKEVPDEFKFHAFDLVLDDSFHDRYSHMVLNLCHIPNCEVVVQCAFDSVDEIKVWFESLLELGYEGVILRIPDSPYKFGRSTAKEGFMLKLKPYESFDTEVLEIVERMENLNESQTNELGQSFKRNTKGDKQGTGMASSFYTELDGVRGKVVFGGDEAARREIWENRESYIGKTAEWKGMLVGSKDFPRHPTFLNWRGDK